MSIDAAGTDAPIVGGAGWTTAEADAYRDLFEPDDVIIHLNHTPTPTRDEYGKVMDRLRYAREPNGVGVAPAAGSYVGDWVQVGIRRGMRELTIPIPKIHSTSIGALTWHSHPLSLRREHFPAMFAHDFSLHPEQCGGPVVDLAGNVVGLNIARADATRTLAIPADTLQSTIKDLLKQAGNTAQ